MYAVLKIVPICLVLHISAMRVVGNPGNLPPDQVNF
jgi:hypothetical protein